LHITGKKTQNGTLTRILLCILVRFWGWTENEREVVKDKQEMEQRLKDGKPLYGDSMMPQHIQDESARNSRFAQLKFSKSKGSNGSH